MLDETGLAAALDIALDAARHPRAGVAGEAEAVLLIEEQGLTRYANSIIHQNMKLENATLTIRAAQEGRVGVASTNRLDRESIAAAVERARTIAANSQPNPAFAGLPAPTSSAPALAPDPAVDRTRAATPQERARAVATVIAAAREAGLSVAGACSTEYFWMGVANTHGVRAAARTSAAELRCVSTGPTSTGFAADAAHDVARLDPARVAREAIDTALRSAEPRTVAPGDWEVVLSPVAVGELLNFLSFLGFGALAYQEGRSFLTGRLGEQLFDPQLTLRDDPTDRCGLPWAIDPEGTPTVPLTLVEDGTACALAYDYTTAHKDGVRSTGHALPQPNTDGPHPRSLFLAPGAATVADLIAGTRRGLYITRFWYTRVVHPVRTTLTGMTRDGTFLIENGALSGGVKNLRYTDDLLRVFQQVAGLGRETRLVRSWLGAARVPALHLPSFHFTGGTEF